jgi:uncharacterized protein (TIGR03067 family)
MLVLTIALAIGPKLVSNAQEYPSDLLGVWQAISIERAGEQAPPEAVKLMRMTFKKDELLVRGNFQDEREVSCKYKIDAKESPVKLDFTPPGEKSPVLGILRIENGKLEICMRNANKPLGRPRSFDASEDDSLVFIRFERFAPRNR